MKKLIQVIAVVVVIAALGSLAKSFNVSNHQQMALEHCGNKENIKRVDSTGFECIAEVKQQ